MERPVRMGILHVQRLRGKEIFSFEYEESWLLSDYAVLLDPDIQLYRGLQYLPEGEKANFGLFMDSAPDHWGRVLMNRREAALARKEGRKARKLFETDYLLGVQDFLRMGALRFKFEEDGPFLADEEGFSVPPWTSLAALEQISLRLEEDASVDEPEYLAWLNMLMAPGSSLGGARPKASVQDREGALWIAKFPSRSDSCDVGAWEMVAWELARGAGLRVAPAMSRKFAGRHHTFLTKRFDRTAGGARIHFSSAITQLGYTDGDDKLSGVSYLELAEFIENHGARVEEDLKELWRRIVFYIGISNTDDHLRNHGFLLTDEGWRLSPAYDMNPQENSSGLCLNITETDHALDIDLAREIIPYFFKDDREPEKIIGEVRASVSRWRNVARRYGIPLREQEEKAGAFLWG